MSMSIVGTLKVKKGIEVVNDKFQKREFVVTDNSSQYPQHIAFQLTQAKCDLIDSYPEGSEVKVHFNIRWREWTSPQGEIKYFNTLEAWKIEGNNANASNYGTSAPAPNAQDAPMSTYSNSAESDDLPF